MAGATAISVLPLLNTLSPPQPLSTSSNYLLPNSSFYHCSRRFRNPRFTIPNAKIGEEASDEIDDGTFFELMEEDDGDGDGDSDDEESEDTESSIDLLSRFVGSMFRKLSKRVRKESRSVLPEFVSPQLLTEEPSLIVDQPNTHVSFSVDGVLLLTLLSIVKALLEVVCTLGGTVFVVILIIRVIWAAVSYFQSSVNNLNQNGPSYGRTQPVA